MKFLFLNLSAELESFVAEIRSAMRLNSFQHRARAER